MPCALCWRMHGRRRTGRLRVRRHAPDYEHYVHRFALRVVLEANISVERIEGSRTTASATSNHLASRQSDPSLAIQVIQDNLNFDLHHSWYYDASAIRTYFTPFCLSFIPAVFMRLYYVQDLNIATFSALGVL